MRACSLCKKKYEKGSGSLFHLPKDVSKRKLWGEICGKNFAPTSLICAKHFRPTSIIHVKNKMLLLPNAEPFVDEHADVEIPADDASNIPNAESHCLDQSNAHFTVDSSVLTEPSHNGSSSFFSWEELTLTANPYEELPMEQQNRIFKEQCTQTDPSIFSMDGQKQYDRILQLESENKDLKCKLYQANMALDAMRKLFTEGQIKK